MSGVRRALVDARRVGQFASVGAMGAGVDLLASATLLMAGGVPPELAKLVGAECAIVAMFLINDRWTFLEAGSSGRRGRFRRLVTSNVVRSGGVLVQLVTVFVLTRTGVTVHVGGTDLWPILTMPVAIACGFALNYAGETLVTWRAHR